MNYYKEIKNELINNEITKKIKDYSKNRSDLTTYYNVGKLLSEAGKHYGEGIIKKYSERLTSELGKGYTITNLKLMRQFFVFSKSHTVCDLLTWSHYCAIIWFDDIVKSLEKNMIQIFMCLFKIKIKNNCIITMEML